MGVFKMFQDDDEGRKTSTSIFSSWKDNEVPALSGNKEIVVVQNPNPNPNNYTVQIIYQCGNYLVIKIKYHDSTNYEGDKILVFENCTYDDLEKQKTIDPHFSENKNFHSPIARFEPTERGWDMAVSFVRSVLNK
jgi:hypothetical protein